MNGGCYNNDISRVLISVNAIDKNKLSEVEIKKEDIKFSYRGTNLPNHLIITAKLRGNFGNKEEIEKKQLEFIEKKIIST